jgi:putative holliday junction resolvase
VSRILGIDLGTRRIGVALSDPTGTVASPLATLPHRSLREDVDRIVALCTAHAAGAVVVGWPRNMDGTFGPAAKRAEQFARALRRAVPVPVELWDERLSTIAAERSLIAGNVNRRRRQLVRDRVAAALILQAALDARTRGLPAPSSGHKDP